MKRPLLLLPLLALAAGCASTEPRPTVKTDAPVYRTVRLAEVVRPVVASDPDGLSCRIVEVRSNVAKVRFSNKTGETVFLDAEMIADAPAFLSLRAYDDAGRVCSTNSHGASPDGFWSPGMRVSRILTENEIKAREASDRPVRPGEALEGGIDVPAFLGSVAPAFSVAAIEPAVTVRLSSGEWRTIIGPRADFSVKERLEIQSWTDGFREETGREASGLVLSLWAVPSERLKNDRDYYPIAVYLAPSATGVEKLKTKYGTCWVVDPASPQAARIVAAMRRYRGLSRWQIQPASDHLALLVWNPDGDCWGVSCLYPNKAYRDFLREVRDTLASATNAPAAPSTAEETHAERAEGAEAEGGSGEAQPPPVDTRAEVEE